MRRALALVALFPPLGALLLAGCPPGGGPGVAGVDSSGTAGAGSAATAAAITSAYRGPDLSYVRAGQRWIYRLQGGAVELVLTVRDVSPGWVRYDVRAVLDAGGAKQSTGMGQPLEHRWTASTQPRRLPEVRDQVVVPGPGEGQTVLDCAVVERDGLRTWSAVVGAEPAFPPEVRVLRGDVVERELVRVE